MARPNCGETLPESNAEGVSECLHCGNNNYQMTLAVTTASVANLSGESEHQETNVRISRPILVLAVVLTIVGGVVGTVLVGPIGTMAGLILGLLTLLLTWQTRESIIERIRF